MSAVSSNSSDRELDALRRAQRAHEPSMEEILASIRSIIADERDSGRADAKPSAQRPAVAGPGPQIVFSKDSSPAERAAQEPPRQPDARETPEASPPRVAAWRSAEAATPDPVQTLASGQDEPLLSPDTDKAVTSAFGALSAELAARSAEVADGIIREMLRPMLKLWLDENLPGIVERLVQAEIERLSRQTQ
jgi:cell pole-organizing protein PopZ